MRRGVVGFARRDDIIREYKGDLIALIAGQKEGRWVCQYLIIDSGVTGYCEGSFATHSEADAAALHVAKTVIDSRRWGMKSVAARHGCGLGS
ncbi:MAG: hypothetical protein OJF51_000150 [Nitrospira sp.]|nr:MAG: hypothetical protein OJF51_000150 [Nitrospira sp.]